MPDLAGALCRPPVLGLDRARRGVLLAVEVATGSGWLLWPAGVAGWWPCWRPSGASTLAQAVLVFALLTISSALLAGATCPSRCCAAPTHDINDTVARLVGHQGRVVAAFQGRSGRVFVDGKEWAAELDEGEGARGRRPGRGHRRRRRPSEGSRGLSHRLRRRGEPTPNAVR